MPEPRIAETKDDFLQRCMGDSEANQTFPDSDQRYAFCNSQWDDRTFNQVAKQIKDKKSENDNK